MDDHGRLFGRINIIDAAVLLVACLLIPLAYGAYLLFSAPPARITAIEPARAQQGLSQLTIHGEHLRPYLRVAIGNETFSLLFENPMVAFLALPPLDPGSYDIVLYDESQELQRLADALVIDTPPLPSMELIVSGAFHGLDTHVARTLAANLSTVTDDNSWGRIIGFQPAELSMPYLLQPDEQERDHGGLVPIVVSDNLYQVRAVIELRCVVEQNECKSENAAVRPGGVIPIAMAGQTTYFTVDETYPARTRDVQLTMDGTVPQGVTAAAFLLSAEDTDGARFPAWDALQPSLVSFTRDGTTATVVVQVPAVRTAEGWFYGGRVLRIGESFSFDGQFYQFNGRIASMAAVH